MLTASDQAGLSGVQEIHYRVNRGAEAVVPGATATVSVPLDGSGEAKVEFFAVDRAGNAEPMNGASLQHDTIAPTLKHSLSPAPNAHEWNHGDVTVHFTATDDDGGSGVDAGRTTPDVLVHDETGGRMVTGHAYDGAGNHSSDPVTVKLDRTGPAISAAVISGARGSDGWYVGPVKVHFTCSDALSGVAVCPDDVTLTENGKGQSVSRRAVDFAGNGASAAVGGIDIDAGKPTITLNGIKKDGQYTLGAVPKASCTAADAVSGPADCKVTVSGGEANGVGTFTYVAKATDKAGNTQTETGSYRVVYRFDGFLPSFSTIKQLVSAWLDIFKAGSTVPVKFDLKRADGSGVLANRPPVWETPTKGGPVTGPAPEARDGGAADTGTSFRVEGTKYQYNWATPKAGQGFYHRIAVRLDDGQTYDVNIGLR